MIKVSVVLVSLNILNGINMEKIIISIVAAVLIGLGTWNLNQTFNLSIEVAKMKTQIEMLTKDLKKIKNKKKKKND
jgi:cytochrome oxidase assembly protein ShyY1|tara:strand:- start:2119 stop:2346 length:228 start_codon:yes stop_codon:yes gene_type:complete